MIMKPEAAETLCEQFNKLYPVGWSVLLIKDLGEVIETSIKWPAEVTPNSTMIGLTGIAGKWLLERVIPKPAPSESGTVSVDYLMAILKAIQSETRPLEGHTDPNAINDCWSEVFEMLEKPGQKAHPARLG